MWRGHGFAAGYVAIGMMLAARGAQAQASGPGSCAACETRASPVIATPQLEVAAFLHVGAGTPYGGIGLALDVMPISKLGIEGGVGLNGSGPEGALMLRPRMPISRHRFVTLGLGASLARGYVAHGSLNGILGVLRVLEAAGHNTPSYAVWEPAYFLNWELGVENRAGRWLMRYYAGYARLLNARAYTCTDGYYPCRPDEGLGLVYVGLAVGRVL